MSPVVVRDARPADARAVAAVQAAAVPHLVRSAAQVAAELRADTSAGRGPDAGRRRWVAQIGGRVVGTASLAPSGVAEQAVSVEVDPAFGSRGAGAALLDRVVSAATHAPRLRAVASADPVALAFAVRSGFVPEAELVTGTVDTHQAPYGPAPPALVPVRLDEGVDPAELAAWWAEAVADDPARLVRPATVEDLRRRPRAAPDHAPELSWGLLAEEVHDGTPRLVALSTSRVDREGARATVEVTAVRPSYRGAGAGTWVLRRTLAALQEAGLDEAWVSHDPGAPAAAALAGGVGAGPLARSVVVERRLPH